MIKKRNLDGALIQWIMTQTGLGPGIGEIKYVAPDTSATSQFRTQLESMGVSSGDIFTLPSLAEAAMEGYRNDVMLVSPGAYAETAEIAWDKAWSHIIGMGGSNIGGDYSEPNVVIYTITADVTQVLNVTGQNSKFMNFVVENNKDDADNLAAALINIYGTHWRNVAFHGNMQSTQNSTAAAASLYIGGAGMYPLIENCIIGQDVWGARAAANSGVLRFTSVGQPNGGLFKDCQFLSVGTTATCAMVAIPVAGYMGRGWLFNNCTFQHFDSAGADESLNQAFYTVTGQHNHAILLHKCSSYGIDEWQDGNFGVVASTMGVATVGGGLHIEPTATVS
jgi:hypothetical protein